ncbi:unnamed protein product [Bursaphelenchus okinawaensis]|uniref:BTB domain-containing protein n=1 Tax=Bursaphelenchus okinawaensis TaxID=465554 RepID=A0A811LK33_9BILA|nr:unnamed protein product [Bursaphelenchus okinawaensis]CAG9125158.1 unnamed protein product [Bursaphelenchus okinawaensis]
MERPLPSLICERTVSVKYQYGNFPKFVINLDPEFYYSKEGSNEKITQLLMQFNIEESNDKTYFNLKCLNEEFSSDWSKVDVFVYSTHWIGYLNQRWSDPNNFRRTVSLMQPRLNYLGLLMNDELSDFTLICPGKDNEQHKIPVHRILLYQSSPYFRSLFSNFENFKENQAGSSYIDVDYNAIYEILYFMYTGNLSKTIDDNIAEAGAASEYFMMDELTNALQEKTKLCLTQDNAGTILESALACRVDNVAQIAFKFIKKVMTKQQKEQVFADICGKLPSQFAEFVASLD